MRIGYFVNLYPRATDTFVQREVAGLRALGLSVQTYSLRRADPGQDVSQQIIDEKARTTYLLPAGLLRLLACNLLFLLTAPGRYLHSLLLAVRTARPGFKAMLWQAFYWQEAMLLARQVRRDGITHLHNHFGDAGGTVTLLASMLSGVGFSITIHGPHIFFQAQDWALREKIAAARFVVCISHYCKSQLMLYSDPADWDRLQIVHCSVDTSAFAPAPTRAISDQLLFVGRLAAEKGVRILLESMRILAERGCHPRLRLIGDGPERAELQALTQEWGLGSHVDFSGYAGPDEVRAALRSSDVFVLPSFAEGVPVSLMEAMASGVPVIATAVGGVTELVRPEETGLVVPPADALALAEAIERCLKDVQLHARLARQGRAMVESQFDARREILRLEALFRQHAAPGERHD